MISSELISNAYSYSTYRSLLDALFAMGKTTGADQSESMLAYAKINLQRMQRIEKTARLSDDLTSAITKIKESFTWLILTEGWCGDAAQNLPLFSLIEQHTEKIQVKLVLRDENLPLMDQHLTNGGRAIPKLICLNTSGKTLFSWGPRPAEAQRLVALAKEKGQTKEEMAADLHAWYAKDKLTYLQIEISALIKAHML